MVIEVPVFAHEHVMMFGRSVWGEVIQAQLSFLAERPLLERVLGEPVWGIAHLQGQFKDEWWEVEVEKRAMDNEKNPTAVQTSKRKGEGELADMAIYLLTMDALDSRRILPSSFRLMVLNYNILEELCEDFSMCVDDLVDGALEKVEMNKNRFPVQAFQLTNNPDYDRLNRLEVNLKVLREIRRGITAGDESISWEEKIRVDEYGRVFKI